MYEQAGPKQLVRDVALAEEAGFDVAVISDHYFPWLDAQGHSPYAWSVLGAAAQATDHIPLMTYATCPIRRYHPSSPRRRRAEGGNDAAAVRGRTRTWLRRHPWPCIRRSDDPTRSRRCRRQIDTPADALR
jgi:Luciferase-like monooxygenase